MEGNQQSRITLLQKVVDLIKKDSKEKNESNKRVLMLRLLSLVMCLYFLVLLILFCFAGKPLLMTSAIICELGYIIVLMLTYYNKSMVAYWFQNVVTIAWMTFFVIMLGWDCGAQHFVFVMVVLACFATFDAIFIKISYIVCLCAMRIALYFYARANQPLADIADILSVEIQLVNTVTIFICITIISLIISNFSQEAEKKLVIYNKKLEKMANRDALTGLMNRRSMVLYLENSCIGGKRVCTDSIAIGDIDFFKKVNDQYGHECGDVVLRELSKLLEEAMNGKGMVARWGGEEFLFFFEQTNGDDALVYLWEILRKIRKMTIPYGDLEIHITMTLGLEEYNGINFEETIRKADDKLYMGKSKGRNQIVY